MHCSYFMNYFKLQPFLWECDEIRATQQSEDYVVMATSKRCVELHSLNFFVYLWILYSLILFLLSRIRNSNYDLKSFVWSSILRFGFYDFFLCFPLFRFSFFREFDAFCFIINSLRHCLEYHVMEQGTVEACHWADCGHQFSAADDISVSCFHNPAYIAWVRSASMQYNLFHLSVPCLNFGCESIVNLAQPS